MNNDMNLKVKTEMIRVRVYTSDFEIEGLIHVKPGGYSGRVTDLLNMSKVAFLPLTDARYRLRKGQATEFIDSECLVLKIDNIQLLDYL